VVIAALSSPALWLFAATEDTAMLCLVCSSTLRPSFCGTWIQILEMLSASFGFLELLLLFTLIILYYGSAPLVAAADFLRRLSMTAT
jgi:hypothetical protein